VSTPDEIRRRLFRDHALIASVAAQYVTAVAAGNKGAGRKPN